MSGRLASIATAGSFCLFCANGPGELPTVTSASGLVANAGAALADSAPATRIDNSTALRIRPPARMEGRDANHPTPTAATCEVTGSTATPLTAAQAPLGASHPRPRLLPAAGPTLHGPSCGGPPARIR